MKILQILSMKIIIYKYICHIIILYLIDLKHFYILSTYKTILSISEGIYKDKSSKFLSFALPVSNVEEIKEIIKTYKKEYFDARHICYAFTIGVENKEWRANDDGEPSGTAGRPIHGQINSKELTNVLVIVVRYFGGVLLGTGGLTTAYKEAAADALNNAIIVEKHEEETISINFDYLQLNDVMKVIKDFNANIIHQNFDNQCTMQLNIYKHDIASFTSKLEKINGLSIDK